jgi:predicted metal-dependent phosphoesterase TrpH
LYAADAVFAIKRGVIALWPGLILSVTIDIQEVKVPLRVEFHCHTYYSKDSLARPEDLLAACRRKGIDRLVITDHNAIAGALYARQMDPERIIIGEEVMTQKGELLAAFVTERIPPHLPPQEAIQRLREQGAFISVSHPFDAQRHGAWNQADLEEITPLVDAIETFNSRCNLSEYNRLAAEYARQRGLQGTCGSDAHAVFELGRAVMILPDFESAESLRAAMPAVRFESRLSSPWVHFFSVYARWVKAWNPEKYPRPGI